MLRFACVLPVLVACGPGGGFPDARPADGPAPTGTFSLSWSVVDQDGAALDCDAIGAQTVTVLSHNLAFEGGQTQVFSCSTGMGTSQSLVVGTYQLDFELWGPSGLLARANRQTGIKIEANENTELVPILFQVGS